MVKRLFSQAPGFLGSHTPVLTARNLLVYLVDSGWRRLRLPGVQRLGTSLQPVRFSSKEMQDPRFPGA